MQFRVLKTCCCFVLGLGLTASAQMSLFNKNKAIRAHVTASTRWIDVSGNFSRNQLSDYADGVCWIQHSTSRLWGVLDSMGQFLIQPKYALHSPPAFSAGICFLPVDADSLGVREYLKTLQVKSKIAPAKPSSIKSKAVKSRVVSTPIPVPLNGYFSIDHTGHILGYYPQYSDIGTFADGIANAQLTVSVKKRGKLATEVWAVYINSKGEVQYPTLKQAITSEMPQAARPLREGLRAHYDIKKHKWGFISSNGNWAIAAQFDEVKDFSCSRAAVRKDDLWGYIDSRGKIKIELRYLNEPYSFSEGYAIVFKTGVPFEQRVCIIDSTGNVVLDKLEDALPFYGGVCYVNGKLGKFSSGRSFLLDKNFKIIKYIKRIEWGHGLNSENYPSYVQQMNTLLLSNAAFSMQGEKLYDSTEKLRPFFCGRSMVYAQTEGEESQRFWGFMNPQGEIVFLVL